MSTGFAENNSMKAVTADRKWVQLYHNQLNIFLYVCRVSRSEYIDPEGRTYPTYEFYDWKVTE